MVKPELQCQAPNCEQQAQFLTNTTDGWFKTCIEHFKKYPKKKRGQKK